jgi:hypothetical protein
MKIAKFYRVCIMNEEWEMKMDFVAAWLTVKYD